jgi:hypothetical protein
MLNFSNLWISSIQAMYVKNPETRKIIGEVKSNNSTNSRYAWKNDHNSRIYS